MIRNLLFGLVLLMIFSATATLRAEDGFTLVSPAQLQEMLPGVTVIDVRSPGHWQESTTMIPGAHRRTAKTTGQWSAEYERSAPLVLYCA